MKTRKYSYNKEIFLERFQTARKSIGCETAKEFSKKTGIQEATISKWRDNAKPRLETMLDICNVCGCDLDYLLGRSKTFRMENETVHKETALTESAIEKLRDGRGKPYLSDFVSFLLTHESFDSVIRQVELMSSVTTNRDKRILIEGHPSETITEVSLQEVLDHTLSRDIGKIVSDYISSRSTPMSFGAGEEFDKTRNEILNKIK